MKVIPINHSRYPVRPKYILIFCSVFFLIALCLKPLHSNAQYFYKDLWNNQRLIREFNILKKERLSTIKLKSFEGDGGPSDGFFCEKKINKTYTQSQMLSKSNITGQSLLTVDYNIHGQPVKSVDETPYSTNTTQYEYDDSNRLKTISIITRDDDDSAAIIETHEYFYNEAGVPLKMIRKKNNVLVSAIAFVTDSVGNVAEEDPSGNSADTKFYYYYDDKNRLTDVVHFSERAQRLLPEYMYEYNDQDLPVQMISTEEGSSNYFIWQYTYNDKNLLETEKCFSKQKELLGTIQYEYN
ncbi:MAG TPA: hypothetical protein VG847_03670 [Chitinophagaceae bacterium]|nr:hypothetical protein [Chitinophagaceae bacterium]